MVTLKGHSDIVMGMMVMSSLDNLVSASLDTSIRVWDTYTQKPVHTLLGHNKVLSTRTASDDGDVCSYVDLESNERYRLNITRAEDAVNIWPNAGNCINNTWIQ